MNHAYQILFALLSVSAAILFFRRRKAVQPAPFDVRRTLPLRGLLALLVVAGHSDSIVPGNAILHYFHLSTPAVSVFFFLSGYGLFKSMSAGRESYLDCFLSRSAVKLAVPLVSAAVVMCICLEVEFGKINLLSRLEAFALRGVNFPQHSWYVWSLFLLYAYFWFAFRCFARKTGFIVFTGLVLAHYAALRWGLRWQKWWWQTVLSMPVGAVWACCEERIVACIRRISWKFYACALLVMLVMCGCYKFGLRDLSRHAIYCAMGPAVALSAYVIRGLPQTAMRLFSFLGRISFEIYLLHFVGERIIRRAGLGPIESLAVVLAVTVPLAFVVHAADAAIVKRLTRRRP